MVNQVGFFTPIETCNPLTKLPALYLSPLSQLFGAPKEIAVLEKGEEGCIRKTHETSMGITALKIATYILSAGILPLLAILTIAVIRCIDKFHYIPEQNKSVDGIDVVEDPAEDAAKNTAEPSPAQPIEERDGSHRDIGRRGFHGRGGLRGSGDRRGRGDGISLFHDLGIKRNEGSGALNTAVSGEQSAVASGTVEPSPAQPNQANNEEPEVTPEQRRKNRLFDIATDKGYFSITNTNIEGSEGVNKFQDTYLQLFKERNNATDETKRLELDDCLDAMLLVATKRDLVMMRGQAIKEDRSNMPAGQMSLSLWIGLQKP